MFFLYHLLKMLHPAVPTGIETAKRNYFPTDFELILCLFQEFFLQRLAQSIRGHRESQAIRGGFVKSRDKCPLMSQNEQFYFFYLGG
jgi:hypothetical protein